MNIEKYKIGQQVAICGFIEEINIENLRDIENTTHLVINTLTRTIDANLKYETVIIDPTSLKPLVPQYVANWYEEHKDNLNESIWEHLVNWDDANWDDFQRWISQPDENEVITTLVNMHQFGYEVKKEKRYTVRIRNLDDEETYLNYDNFRETWVFYSREDTDRFRTIHTREEIESNGFGWVFNCEGIEVEEVE
ncbi:hypothetical protein PP200_gp39 [Streptococcus phage CHPC1045]|uniref:DUF1642 domain-containing protein n=2 Tax=Moineauvirus TaxID=1623304 RepID=A0A3G8F9Y1_9CAUD|nr:hypothetical protein PP200_gp39 [Streptococcus phage CHPC1045]YP_010645404.1 hypothetical protein PP201_gp41 [Streptococcus phage CHPC1046]AXF53700.1 hypothetical protein [Streptococcus phage 140]AZF91657.1 hypothetical protein CHPC1048_0041 [Streptococcus phage CHPC1048]AZF91611.1 hypothetical protein CHPC1046_0041 [Streptococcus phage CHPC1046]AZF92650.1 hypothetical protein CHPC1045_0040 [Streptococcus phage CHPC1045]